MKYPVVTSPGSLLSYWLKSSGRLPAKSILNKTHVEHIKKTGIFKKVSHVLSIL